ncbi:hypothetical protein HY642_05130 [Candidatus Woesearchaeota archaeon]|nr:hypothetical protein [Candidatus Woesearchaeota archaeon]
MRHYLSFLIVLVFLVVPFAQAKLEEEEFNKFVQDDFTGRVKDYIDKLGTDAVLGQEMSNELQQLVHSAKAQWDNEQGVGCALAANVLAEWNLNELSREYLKGGLRTIKKIMKNILSVGSSGLVDFLKGKAKDQIEGAIDEYFDTQPPEVYTNERSNTGELACGNTYERIIWDKKAGAFELFIAGDCMCKEVQIERGKGARIKLKNWVVYISGDVKVTIEDGKAKYSLVNVKQMTYANCGCDEVATGGPSDGGGAPDGGDTTGGGDTHDGDDADTRKDKTGKPSLIDRIISWFGFGKKPARQATGTGAGGQTGIGAGGGETGTGQSGGGKDTGGASGGETGTGGVNGPGGDAGKNGDTGGIPPPKPFCGDNACNADEDCASCTADCGCAAGLFCQFGKCSPPECAKDGDCDKGEACTLYDCVNPGKADALCSSMSVFLCTSGDGCCPSLCKYETDTDCPKSTTPTITPPKPTTPTTPPTPPPEPTTPACTWACASWGACSSGTQTRTCTSSPSPCTGTNPNPTSQSCTPPATCNLDNLGNCLSGNCVGVYGPGGSANCPERCNTGNAYDTDCLANQCNTPYQECLAACRNSNPPCTMDDVYRAL